jgi:CRISPR-associated protein Cas1
MRQHLNTLFVTTQDSYLAKAGKSVLVRVEKETRLRVPVHTLGGIVCFGRVGVSPSLMGLCGQRGVTISMLTEKGGFLAKIGGFTPGNVLLRREQYRRADDPGASAAIARAVICAKVATARSILLRNARDYPSAPGRPAVESAAARMAEVAEQAVLTDSLDVLRGLEGEAANYYFAAFNNLLTAQRDAFALTSRSRRPPLDPINALLSFLYAMLGHDARAACEAVGLDPQVGFLHRDRPGRAGLALDLIEEFRPYLADRPALSLVNRGQVRAGGFVRAESGGVSMDDAIRRAVLVAYQKRKQEEVVHPFLNERVSVGLLVHLQARLLARHLRGDLDAYPASIWR